MSRVLATNKALREAGEAISEILKSLEVDHDLIITELAIHGVDVTSIEDPGRRTMKRVSISARDADRPGEGWA